MSYESIPFKLGPLSGRVNIIIRRLKDFKAKGSHVVWSVEGGIELAKNTGEWELLMIGGGDVYKEAWHVTSKTYLLLVHRTFIDNYVFSRFHFENRHAVNGRRFIIFGSWIYHVIGPKNHNDIGG